jgi:hypothetical protein
MFDAYGSARLDRYAISEPVEEALGSDPLSRGSWVATVAGAPLRGRSYVGGSDVSNGAYRRDRSHE